jgi:sialic acid synthase SpsE
MIALGHRTLGGGSPCYVIAEAGVNHNGEVALARRLVDAAAEAGADAVKFQTFDPTALAAVDAPCAEYQGGADAGPQRAMLERLTLTAEAHRELKARAEARGLVFLSSPFDERSADLLADLGVVALKVPSGEVTNLSFLRYLARKGRPLLVSTGMCDLDDVRAAVDAVRSAADPPLALFHCVSSYPAAAADANLRAMDTLRESFGCPVGFSDHTPGIAVSLAAVALGAELIEKHLTLDRSMSGPDHAASLEPAELAALVRGVREVEAARGDGVKRPRPAELAVAQVARKSLHYRVDLAQGARLGAGDLIALRPGTGVPPAMEEQMVGRRLRVPVRAGRALREEDLER